MPCATLRTETPSPPAAAITKSTTIANPRAARKRRPPGEDRPQAAAIAVAASMGITSRPADHFFKRPCENVAPRPPWSCMALASCARVALPRASCISAIQFPMGWCSGLVNESNSVRPELGVVWNCPMTPSTMLAPMIAFSRRSTNRDSATPKCSGCADHHDSESCRRLLPQQGQGTSIARSADVTRIGSPSIAWKIFSNQGRSGPSGELLSSWSSRPDSIPNCDAKRPRLVPLKWWRPRMRFSRFLK